MRAMRMSLWLIVAAATSIVPPVYTQEAKRDLRQVFEKSREQSDFRFKGNTGLMLRGRFRVTRQKGSPSEGSYLYLETPDGQWEEVFELDDYKRTRMGNGNQFWQVRSQAEEDAGIEEFGILMASLRAPKIEDKDQLSKIKLKGESGTGKECIKITSGSGLGRAYCFDEKTNDLLEAYSGHSTKEIPWKIDWTGFSKFQEWSGKRIPMLLQGYNEDHLAAVAQLKIEPMPKLAPNFFAKPEGATVWADCGGKAVWKLKNRVQPRYPAEARMQRRSGTVVVAAIIEEDGRISNIKPVFAKWPELYESARTAVSEWRYERTPECSASKGRTETLIDVVYTLFE